MLKNIKRFIAVSGLLALCASAPAFAATSDYVHYWSFDEGTGRSAGDFGGQNGVLTGSSTGFGWASGKVGTALAMDGMTGEGVALPNGFLTGSQGTLSVWLDMMELSDHNIIFSGRSTSDRNIYAAFAIDRDGRPLFQFRNSTDGNDRKAQGARLINKNEWVNVVLTGNGQGYHMFVNGEEVTVAGDNIGRWFPDFTNQTFMYRIGTLDANPLSGSWNGYLDDLKIFDRALSLDEIIAMYNIGNNARTATPAAIAPKINLTISSDHVPYGGSVAVNWMTDKVDTCSATGDWSGTVATSGSKVFVKLAGAATYGLSCSGKGGTADARVHVSISDASATSSLSTSATSGLTVTDVTVHGDSTAGNTTITSTSVAERRAQLDALIKQILALIAELQKQLAALKASGAR